MWSLRWLIWEDAFSVFTCWRVVCQGACQASHHDWVVLGRLPHSNATHGVWHIILLPISSMPQVNNLSVITVHLLHPWKRDSAEPSCPYDDPGVNAKLGIKRDHGTTARSDCPVDIPAGDRPLFNDFVSACNNATLEQIWEVMGAANGREIWGRFCTNIIFPAFNKEIKRQLMEAEVHPQQLLEKSDDIWHSNFFHYSSQSISRALTQRIFGETVVVNFPNHIHDTAVTLMGSAVASHLERLRGMYFRELQRNLEATMRSKHPHIS